MKTRLGRDKYSFGMYSSTIAPRITNMSYSGHLRVNQRSLKGERVLEIPKLPVIRATTAKVPTELWRDVANNEYAKQEKSSKCQWINLFTSRMLIWTTIHLNSDSTGQKPVKYRHFNSSISICHYRKETELR